MKTLLIICFTSLAMVAQSQNLPEKKIERKGLIFGTSIGISSVCLKFNGENRQQEMSASFPNFKIGMMVSDRMALMLSLPGSIYKYQVEGRERDRGFEAIVPSVQYWLTNRLWLHGGIGVGLDAPAFYDIESEEERKYYFGKAAILALGYEFWQKERFAIDVQTRVHYGTAKRPEGQSNGLAFNLIVGFNWF